jgi:hypothetical protein
MQNEMAIMGKDLSQLNEYVQEFYLRKKRISSMAYKDEMLTNKLD